jgi:peptide-methionine (S)-S-oxide reductase
MKTRIDSPITMRKLFWTVLLGGVIHLTVWAQPTKPMTTNTAEFATFGGGCFWCVEAVYERLPGVRAVTSGYAGGHTENPTYKQVCGGDTGHAEVAQIEFDPTKISYTKLLEVFWQAHDPTTLNRQGADVGTQYRSVIFYHDEKQKLLAEKSKIAAQAEFNKPIVTEIVPLKKFYAAEDYHQGYFDDHKTAPYCQAVIAPKLEKLEHKQVIQKESQIGK